MVKILEGRTLSKEWSENLSKQVSSLGSVLRLMIFQVGNKSESNLYIEKKIEFGKKIGVEVKHIKFREDISQKEIESEIKSASGNSTIHGIIVQLPIPSHLDFDRLMENVDPKKDVDGLTSLNAKKLLNNDPTGIIPATTKGVLSLLDYYKIPLEGKRAVIIGRSALVGKPVAISFLNKNATVTICHRKTKDLEEIAKQADILVTAMGDPEFIGKKYVSSGQVIIDIGINTVSGFKMEDEVDPPAGGSRKVVGDVKFDEVKDIVSAITPVPGGVGPLTVAALFQNLVDSYRMQN